MTAIALAGLALLPPTFLLAAILLPEVMRHLRPLFNAMGLLSAIVFVNQLMIEVPAVAVPAAGLYYMLIALLILYVLLELFALLVVALTKWYQR